VLRNLDRMSDSSSSDEAASYQIDLESSEEENVESSEDENIDNSEEEEEEEEEEVTPEKVDEMHDELMEKGVSPFSELEIAQEEVKKECATKHEKEKKKKKAKKNELTQKERYKIVKKSLAKSLKKFKNKKYKSPIASIIKSSLSAEKKVKIINELFEKWAHFQAYYIDNEALIKTRRIRDPLNAIHCESSFVNGGNTEKAKEQLKDLSVMLKIYFGNNLPV